MLQPTLWSCWPTCLAIIAKKTPLDIMEIIGHDGSEIMSDGMVDPQGRRAFNDMEILYAAEKLGIHIMPFMPSIKMQACIGSDRVIERRFEKQFEWVFNAYSGIVCGFRCRSPQMGHAVVWDHNREVFYDPVGSTLDRKDFYIEVFYAHVNPTDAIYGR